jgi:phosphoribosylaminoimidazolecarboxamide formyltransferase/IMP cyclohydrolase
MLSVSDKSGLVELGRGLVALGAELVSTGGTAKALTAAGLPVTGISEVTGFPEMMDGRVKTLHPNIHGGILARRHRSDDLEALARHGIKPVDLVVVNLYPFARAAANAETAFDDLVEEIDIGGPSLVRAAAKNFRDVLVVVDPSDYARVLEALAAPAGPSLAFRFELARRAFAHTAAYDETISVTLDAIALDETTGEFDRTPAASAWPAALRLRLEKIQDLRYGENPHQRGAWYRESAPATPARSTSAGNASQGSGGCQAESTVGPIRPFRPAGTRLRPCF